MKINIQAFFITLLIWGLASCMKCPTKNFVAVPVTMAPKITVPSKPHLLVTQLTPQSKPMDVEKAQVTDLDALMTYSNQLLKVLESLNL